MKQFVERTSRVTSFLTNDFALLQKARAYAQTISQSASILAKAKNGRHVISERFDPLRQ
ncbi:MAG: hypothetical protein NVSMB6_26990 [Burkholderiaceae bacterium]